MLYYGGSNYTMTRAGNVCSIKRTSQSEAAYTYKVYVNDTLGNNNVFDSRTISLDTTSTTADYASDSTAEATQSSTTILMNITMSDSLSGNAGINIWLYNSSNNAFISSPSCGMTSFCSSTQNGLSQGTYFYNGSAQDNAGNMVYLAARTVTIDTTSPSSLSFISPTEPDNSAFQRNWYYVNITFTETYPSACALEVNNVNISMTRAGNNCFINQTSQSDGTYAYKVYVNDTAGNTGSSSRTITLDNTVPGITIVSPTNIIYGNSTIELKMKANEATSVWRYSLNNGANITFTPNTTISPIIGANTLIVYANDTVGNTNSSTISFNAFTCGATLVSSLTLNQDLNSAGTCYTIGANNLVIDGNGYSITGNTSGYGINTNGKDSVTIKNFAGINNFTNGIYASGTVNSTLFNNTLVVANIPYDYGIYLLSSSNNNISLNTITTFGSNGYGIIFSSSDSNTLSTNTITTSSSDGYGIYLSTSDSNILSTNTITTSDSLSYGIQLTANSDSNIFTSNKVKTTSSYSLYLKGGSNNTFTDDNLTAINSNDIRIDDGAGTLTNVTFTKTDIGFDTGATGSITVKWYLGVTVKNSTNNLQNATVNITNITSSNIFSGLTNSNGIIPRQTLTEYFRNSTYTSYETPHTINTTIAGHIPNLTIINLTKTSSTSVTILLNTDTTPPTTLATATKSDTSAYVFDTFTKFAPISVTLSCSDTQLTCDKTLYCADSSNLCTPNTVYSAPLSISTEGTSYIRYNSNDTFGNTESTLSQTIKLDTVAPAVTSNPTSYPGSQPSASNGQQITLNATITDATSGI